MSELTSTPDRKRVFRHDLLASGSILALLAAAPQIAAASSGQDRPTVWLELGGQLERVDTPYTVFAPQFFDLASSSVLGPMVEAQRPSRYSTGVEGKITFEPRATDWIVSAALRYGRTRNARHPHYQTPGIPSLTGQTFGGRVLVPRVPARNVFGDGQSNFGESHFILDFQAGKDVGLGIFGRNGTSVFSVGVRYAQFTSKSDVTLHARPVYGFGPFVQGGSGKYSYKFRFPYRQTYTAIAHAERSTHAVGPSLSWDGSLPLVRMGEDQTIDFNWGANAAILFGKQRVSESHQTTGYYYRLVNQSVNQHGGYVTHPDGRHQTRSVIIPNVGGFAGLSLKFPNAKLSLGYRGDFFFNATDSGLDARDAADQNFYGPFATVSIGLGG